MLIRRLILFSIEHTLLNQAILDKLAHITHLCPIWALQTAGEPLNYMAPAQNEYGSMK